MKPSRRVELARRRAEAELDRLESLRAHDRLTGDGFLVGLPPIRSYLAAVSQARSRPGADVAGLERTRERVLARTKSLAVSLGLGGAWDETMEGEE